MAQKLTTAIVETAHDARAIVEACDILGLGEILAEYDALGIDAEKNTGLTRNGKTYRVFTFMPDTNVLFVPRGYASVRDTIVDLFRRGDVQGVADYLGAVTAGLYDAENGTRVSSMFVGNIIAHLLDREAEIGSMFPYDREPKAGKRSRKRASKYGAANVKGSAVRRYVTNSDGTYSPADSDTLAWVESQV